MDESTSPERQVEIVENWSGSNDHAVIGWATDMDVSRSVDPFDTPELGPWLRDPEKIDQWDIIVCWKLDRLATGSIYLNRLMSWCQEHGKTIVSVSENFDLGHWVGRLIANVIAGVAEGELEAIKERTAASRMKLMELGRWPGGRPPYGYTTDPLPGGGYVLKHDLESLRILREIIDRTLVGQPTLAITRDLTARGVLSMADYYRHSQGDPVRGDQWEPGPVRRLLESPALRGFLVYDGKPFRGRDGRPVRVGPEIVSYEEHKRLIQALKERANVKTITNPKNPGLRVIVCYDCEKPLYRQVKGDGKYVHYFCKNGCTAHIDAAQAETLLEETFIDQFGDQPMVRKVYIPAESHETEIQEASDAIDELTTTLRSLSSATARRKITEQISALDVRLEELESLPTSEARTELLPVGKTWGEEWNQRDTEGRRQLLESNGIKLRIKITDRPKRTSVPGVLHFHLYVPDELKPV